MFEALVPSMVARPLYCVAATVFQRQNP